MELATLYVENYECDNGKTFEVMSEYFYDDGNLVKRNISFKGIS